MLLYTSAPYPIYSPQPAFYSVPLYHPEPVRVPTARERYLKAVADAQTARARYISELEEQRVLSILRQQEALRHAAYRQRQAIAAQNALSRRRAAYLSSCQQQLYSPQRARREQFQRQPVYLNSPQDSSDFMEELLAAILGGHENDVEQQFIEKKKLEEIRAEKAKQEATFSPDETQFIKGFKTLRELLQAAHNSSVPKPSETSPTGASTGKAAAQPTSSDKRGAKNIHERAARTIQRRWRSHSADRAARKDALATISTLEARFLFLKNTFSFPEHLEFRDGVDGRESEVPGLLFTSANAAVHTYAHELTRLLTLADAVPSGGSREVRNSRRVFIQGVEAALDELEVRIAKVWGKRVDISSSAPEKTGPVTDVSSATTPQQESDDVDLLVQAEFIVDESGELDTGLGDSQSVPVVLSSDTRPSSPTIDERSQFELSIVHPSEETSLLPLADSRTDGADIAKPSTEITIEGGAAQDSNTAQDQLLVADPQTPQRDYSEAIYPSQDDSAGRSHNDTDVIDTVEEQLDSGSVTHDSLSTETVDSSLVDSPALSSIPLEISEATTIGAEPLEDTLRLPQKNNGALAPTVEKEDTHSVISEPFDIVYPDTPISVAQVESEKIHADAVEGGKRSNAETDEFELL